MDRSRRNLIIAATLLATAALFILADSLPGLELQAGSGQGPGLFDFLRRLFMMGPRRIGLPSSLLRVFRLAFWSTMLLTVLYAFLFRKGRRELRRVLPDMIIGIAVIVGVALLARALSGDATLQLEPAAEAEALPAVENLGALQEPGEDVSDDVGLPAGLTTLLSLLVSLGAAGLLYVTWRGRQRATDAPPLEALSRRAHEAIEELRAGSDFGDVILRCYSEMARTVADERGVRRACAATPREFEVELRRLGLPTRPVQRLTRLFEMVRYGRFRAGKREQLEALDSLQAIVDACERLQGRQALPASEEGAAGTRQPGRDQA
jgi:hypothetical protein